MASQPAAEKKPDSPDASTSGNATKDDAKPEAPPAPDLTRADSLAKVAPPEASPEAPIAEEVVRERATPVTFARFSIEAENNTVFRCNVKPEVTPEQCMDEEFWTHVSGRLIPGDTIRVMPDDMSWELVLHVYNAGHLFAHVTKKHYYDLKPARPLGVKPSRYTTDYAGSTHKHRFLRDGEVMRDGFATKALAQRAAANHQAAVDRKTPKIED